MQSGLLTSSTDHVHKVELISWLFTLLIMLGWELARNYANLMLSVLMGKMADKLIYLWSFRSKDRQIERLIPFVTVFHHSWLMRKKENCTQKDSFISERKKNLTTKMTELQFFTLKGQPLEDDYHSKNAGIAFFFCTLLRIVHETTQSKWGLRVNRTVRKVTNSNSFHCLFSR